MFFLIIEENAAFSHGKTIGRGKLDSLLCARQSDCKIANFIGGQKTCSLLREERAKEPQKPVRRGGHFRLGQVCLK